MKLYSMVKITIIPPRSHIIFEFSSVLLLLVPHLASRFDLCWHDVAVDRQAHSSAKSLQSNNFGLHLLLRTTLLL